MATIVFPKSTAPGTKPHESAGRLINAYAESLQQGAPAEYVIRRAPGLASFVSSDYSGFRGGIFTDPLYFGAFEDVLVSVDSAGTLTEIDALPGDLPVTFARNNKTPTPDYVCVTQNGAFSFSTGGVVDFADADLPQPNSVCFLDGYFFFTIADGRCFASGLNDVTINALDVTRAEANADGLVRGVAYDRDLLLFGNNNCEVWSNTAEATGFPFSRTTVIRVGLAGQWAIAGFEEDFAAGLMWVGGDNCVHALNGYSTQIVSPPDLNALIEAVSDKSTLYASVYVVRGHPCWKLTGPTFTWVYDFSEQAWHERKSYLADNWRFTGNSVHAFGKWLGGDSSTGAIVYPTEATYRELTDPLIWEIESIAMESFPARIGVPRADFNFVTGTGIVAGEDPIERQPQVAISWSDDGGNAWSTPVLRALGPTAKDLLVSVNRTGISGHKGRRWRLTVADPVYVGFMHGDMSAVARAA